MCECVCVWDVCVGGACVGVCVDTEHVVLARDLALSPDPRSPASTSLVTKSVLFPSVSLLSLPGSPPTFTTLLFTTHYSLAL